MGRILSRCKSKPRKDVRWFTQGRAQVLPKKALLKKLNLFSLAYLHRRKKAASEITQPDPWGKGGKKSKQGSFWCSQQPQYRLGPQAGRGKAANPPKQSDEQSLSGTKDICWVNQESTRDKDKARQYHTAPQSAPARCQGQRQRTRPMSQEESIMLNNSASSTRSKSAQTRLKRALQSEIRLKSVMWRSGVLAAAGKWLFKLGARGLDTDVCYPSFSRDLKREETLDF